MSNGPIHFRLSDRWTESGEVKVELSKFHVLRETPQGYWLIDDYYWRSADTFSEWLEEHKRWVPKQGSRYCQADILQALSSYAIRKRCEHKHLKARLEKCQHVIATLGSLNVADLIQNGGQSLGFPKEQLSLFNQVRP